eukprot:Hpha_TRINITY_DN3304_c0_g1::TRINITY_DN3304_c0_g1_i1::g.172395::m.172395/K06692/PSMD5; 26S proteasome non-ATPase regulatory subunit 5
MSDQSLTDEKAAMVGAGHPESLPVLEQWEGVLHREPHSAAAFVLRHVAAVIQCVTDEGLRRTAHRVLSLLFSTDEGHAAVLSGSLTGPLGQGCENTDGDVRWVCAKMVEEAAARAAARGEVDAMFSSGLMGFALRLVADERTDVGTRAAAALASVAGQSRGFQNHPEAAEELRALLRGDAVAALRAMDALGGLAAQGEGGYRTADECGVLDAIADGVEAESPDVLTLLNFLEVLATVACSPSGLPFFGRRPGLPARVSALAAEDGDETTACFAFRFISRFAQFSKENGEHAVAQGWYDQAASALRSPSAALASSALGAILGIAHTPAGLARLCESEEVGLVRGRLAGSVVAQQTRERRIEALDLVSGVLGSGLTRGDANKGKLYQLLFGGGVVGDLLALRLSQQEELRRVLGRTLQAFAQVPEAAAECCADNGFWAWLLDMNVEKDKEAREEKHAGIVQLVLYSAARLEALRGAEEVLELRTIARLSAHHTTRPPSEVAGPATEVRQ